MFSTLAYSWTGPSASAPNSNVSAPINTGSTNQSKTAVLGVNGLAVFGNTLLNGTNGDGNSNGVNSYLNFGGTAQQGGYGIRDNAGTLEFKNTGGTWQSLQATVSNLVGSSAWVTNGANIYNGNSGKVGIGVTSPQSLLHVKEAGSTGLDWIGILNNPNNSSGTGYGVGLRLQNSDIASGGNELYKWAGVAAVAGGSYSNQTDLALYTGNFNSGANTTSAPTERVRVAGTTGNVGIGTTNPGDKLDLGATGGIRMGGNQMFASNIACCSPSWYYLANGAAAVLKLTELNSGNPGILFNVFANNSSGANAAATAIPAMFMQASNGNVGIGNTSPNARLQVGDGADGFANRIAIRSNYPTIGFYDVDGQSVFLQNNSNLFYILRGCAANGDTTQSWCQVNSVWPLYIDLTNNNAVFGGNVYGAGFYYNSDRKLKEDIQPLDKGLVALMKLRPVSFTWKSGTPQAGKHDIGLIAQEVQDVLPGIVNKNEREDILTVDYVRITPVLIKAIQEQQQHIQEQDRKLAELQAEIASLEAASEARK